MQRLEGERRVAHPGVAVVPVALAARGLGQRRREGGDRGPGGHVGEALDRERGPLDGLAVAVVDRAHLPHPGAPHVAGGGHGGIGLVDVGGGGEPLGPGQRAVRPLAGVEDVAGPDPTALDAERQVGAQPHRLPGPAGVGGVPIIAHELPGGGGAAVVEHRLADDLDLHLARDALDGAHQHVVGIVVGGRPGVGRDRVLALTRSDGEGVADHRPPARRVPGGVEDVGAGLVGPGRRHVDAEGPHAEVAGLAVEDRAEHAGRVEPGHAQPGHRAVGGDEGARVAVGQEREVLDGRERRRHRRALGGSPGGGGAHDAIHGSCQWACPATSRSAASGPQLPWA